ncbi:myosin-11-like [Watersipora subatra]|uniref:myosin-11-like n=1 Tax=Watersipora subatra TaxID=2589382 RepID=UPI00355B3FAA
MLAARKPLTPEKEPTPIFELDEAEEELLQQTDDAKAELKSRDGQELSAPNSRKGRRSVTFTEDVTNIRPMSSSLNSAFSDRHQVFERIISNLRAMMKEESLDVVQKNALSSLRESIKSADDGMVNTEHTLAMFSLASQISAESVYLGYKPDGLFSSILSMYYQAVEEYNSTLSKLAAGVEDGPVISDLTKLLAVKGENSLGLPKVCSSDTSGRSTPHSRLSSKYRASVEQARQSIAERRSTSPRLLVPDKASFENAELDENVDLPAMPERADRSTSIGSSLYADMRSSRFTSHPESGLSTQTKMSAETATESAKTRKSSSQTAPSVPSAAAQTPAHSVYDKATSLTPTHLADRTTSYSLSKTPALNEDDVVSREISPGTTDNLLINEYMKLYKSILNFKDGLAKVLLDKDMMSPSQVLSEIEVQLIDEDQPIILQLEDLGQSCTTLLADCGLVVQDALQAAFREDYNVSSVVSRATSYAGDPASRANSYGLAPMPPTGSPAEKHSSSGPRRMSPRSMKTTPADSATMTELQMTVQKLSDQLEAEVEGRQADLNHHTAMVMELQDTVAGLTRELALVKEQAEEREEEQSDQESAIMFTRLDAERNAKNLKRALNNNKLTEDKYQAAVDKMDEYISLPAKRFSELVKKYVHHRNMIRIEETIKNRHNFDSSDVDMLERMESLQNLRTRRWMDKMDEFAERRSELASDLMASLEELEQESGIFMIKPMYSYRASISPKNLKIHKTEEGPTQRLGVPVPSQPEPSNEEKTTAHLKESAPTRWASRTPKSTGGTWNLSASVPAGNTGDQNLINTPRILELDVNRMMYSQNQVSMKSNPYLSNDRLVNAANSSVRSYMTVRRPVANGINRPASSGALVTSKSMGSLPDGPKRADSAEAVFTMRTTPPLPPIGRNNTLVPPPETFERVDTGRDSSVNPSRLAREFTDDSIHILPSHVTKIVTNIQSLSREDLLLEEPSG